VPALQGRPFELPPADGEPEFSFMSRIGPTTRGETMIRINNFKCKAPVKAALLSVFLLFMAVAGFGQQQINLTVQPTTTTLPDGTTLPMWGYFCGTAVTGSTASCAALNPAMNNTTTPTWSPVVITVPTGQGLTINLTNNLSFTPATPAGSAANNIPTSIVIVGQVGGGLGAAPTTTPSPSHTLAQGCPTWFIASGATPPGTPCPAPQPGASGTPPIQGPRVQSMGTEVAAGAVGTATATALTWTGLKPGTYLLESGTHPSIQVPMGLIGVLVVTTAPSGTTAGVAYPATTTSVAVPYNAEVPVEFSEIDPVQNRAVDTAVRTAGFSETMVWSGMPTSPQGTPGCGYPSSSTYHQCYPPAVNYTPFYYLINGVAFNTTAPTASEFMATAGVSGTTPVTTGISGTVLVRIVNAGLRLHVPSIVNSLTQGFSGAGAAATVSGFTVIAEDGNVLPNVAPIGATTVPAAPRVQTDVLMVPSKVYDALVNVPAAGATATPDLPIYDRELSLSGNSSERDSGMLAYISVNNTAPGNGLPVAAGSGIFAAAQANADSYPSVAACGSTATSCIPLVISDVSKGVIANDVNVYGVNLLTAPTHGTLTCTSLGNGLCANGTFTYTPSPGFPSSGDSFTYCANNGFTPASGTTAASCSSAALTATVTLGASSLSGNPTAIAQSYTSKMATFIKIPSPGLLVGNSDPNNLPLSVVASSVTLPACTNPITAACGNVDPNGGFTLALPTPSTPPTTVSTATFSYKLQNSQGAQSTASGTVTVTFPVPSNLKVNVLDAQAYNNCNGNAACISGLVPFPDYRWIIEEDQTFWVDPNCTTNSSITTPGCPSIVGPAGQSTVPSFGVNFHTSNMNYVAQGCTGPLSCESGQTMVCGVNGAPACPAGFTPGSHIPAVCDLGNGACRYDPTGHGFTPVNPSEVVLDPAKRYYISILPGDAANPFPANLSNPVCPTNGAEAPAGDANCGHTMSGAPIPPACNILGGPSACTTTSAFTQPVNVLVLPTPLPTGKLSVIVFEDDFPLNGEQDGGGGNATVAPIEPGLGGFNIVLWDTFGGLGDATGQDTYDMFNMPLSNGLAGTIDPTTGIDACPISATPLSGPAGAGPAPASGITGMIVTCPKYEADGQTLSPLAGQAVIYNLMPEKFSVQAYPGADRIARGEQWLQTNTLDGQHPHDSFIRIGEPSYFQEYGPAGYHVAIGFANPAIINARHNDVCAGQGTPGAVGPCTNTITGQVDVQRLSRTPDQRLYPSGSRAALAWTQCWISLGDPDGEDFQFTFCDANGNFTFNNVPGGNWRLTIGDQWNDQIIDGLSTPANVGCTPNGALAGQTTTCPGGQTLDLHNIGVQQWQANLYTRVFVDDNKNGIWDGGEIGIPFLYTRIYYRDGHSANGLNTDFNGIANFNETFPLFNWYVVEADSTRYKTTGTHTVYDAGGPADGSPSCGNGTTARQCGSSTAYSFITNTFESLPLPADLSVPGAVYCAKADCTAEASSFAAGTAIPSSSTASTGRIDPPWVTAEGWSGMTSQGNWIDFGKAPYAACPPACATVTVTSPGATTPTTTQVAENGGIHGQVTYASTRPFDDADQMILQPWEPLVPNVTINLYQEGFAADGVTPTLTMVDTTQTSSWDAWAQGFYPNSTATPGTGQAAAQKPYMNCPGQGTATSGSPNQDLFFFTLFDQPNYLDWYNSVHNGGTLHTLPYNSQYKCYDAMHIWDQLQPAPYDGEYFFPSSLGVDPTTGKPLTANGSTNGVTSNMAGTNCTVCVANPDSTDKYRVGTPMLPPGKYVVEVIMPPGYEVYKEEDKNLLIGDNYIAPVTQQFGGLGTDIFIIPDQASVASLYDETASGFNSTNYQDSTSALGLGDELSGVPGYPGFQDPVWPCVGEQRVVPDYLSLFPNAKEVAPFAGATRPLCDRKEVTLGNQMNVRMHFAIFTSTHIAAKYAGVITDDYTSEFDPFAPQFGEKFAPPNLPISTRDYLGNEISRVYSDHWGTYDGLTYSSWEVNPPNITGYSPTIMVQCMNDPGPVKDTNPFSATYGQMISDPLYNPAYSDFCYEEPYMPGLTNYTDTPVVPTEAYVGAAYNFPDCSYPDTTPAIAEVDGDGVGPWVSKSGVTLTITALGNQQVTNSAYSGPSANTAPFNLKTVGRHYGFGTQCLSPAAGNATCNTLSSVTIGGKSAVIDSWSDTAIQVTVPTGVPNCAIQQQAQYGGSTAQCGQLVITAGNGRQSIDSVTVTIGGKTPTHVSANQTIQSAIDAAAPGDLLIVDPTCTTTGTSPAVTTCSAAALHAATPTQAASVGAHSEMLLMWKPVRLQGVGAVSSVINANANPAGKLLDPWRRHINCLFGLTLQGVPLGTPIPSSTPGGASTPATYDSTGQYSCPDAGWNYFVGAVNLPQIDRLPLEAVVGWDATVNGNLAEQLQEPSLMGAYEGAGITVLGKGVWLPPGVSPWTDGSEPGAFPSTALLLQNVPAGLDDEGAALGPQYSYCTSPGTTTELVPNPYPSNFECNPASIDGLSITDSSQGGGGIFVHGWAHNMQIANNRVYNNAGTLSGGITVGQGEFPIAITIVTQEGAAAGGPTGQFDADAPPSCQNSSVLGTHLPYCLDLNVNIHNNNITGNSSLGDELFSGTLSGGGGATFCTGSDYYKFQYNWVCGNLSSAEGGGVAHIGFIYNGDIEHNSIVLNQSTNPTIPTNGGGVMVMGTPDTDPICGTQIDADCPPGLSDGTGPGLVINANLIQANTAESGSGGGIRLQQVNGTDVSTFFSQPALWNNVAITNNIIVNNVAGWDGAGISLQDSLNVAIINNTIASNDTLASSGVLTQSIGTPEASAPAGNCVQPGPSGPTSASCPQSAGVTSTPNSSVLTTTFTGLTITCPTGQPNCTGFSNPLLENNVIWQNRAFYIGVGALGAGTLNQQNIISLFDAFIGTAAPVQTAYGQCSPGVSYWDLGVRGDAGPGPNTGSGFALNPTYSVLDDPGYTTGSNLAVNPTIVSQYCNGSRVPPTCTVADGCGGPSGYGVPPGIVDASSPNPLFTLTPSATVDEGNNWINVSWGPLSTSDDSVAGGASGNYGGGAPFANYALAAGSPAIDYVPLNSTTFPTATTPSLTTDFFGNPRPDPANLTHFDVGAVEFQGSGAAVLASITPSSGVQGTVVNVTITGTDLALATAVNVSGTGVTVTNFVAASATTVTATFTIAPTATLSARNVTVTTPAGTSNAVTFTVTAPPAPTLVSIAPASELRGTSQAVVLTGTNFVAGTTVVITPAATGVSVSGVTIVSPTTIDATISSTLGAAVGNINVGVTNAGGASNTLPFAITGPVLTAISPVSANRGTSTAVTLTGTGLTGATSVNVSGGGFAISNLTAVSPTEVTATLNIASGAAAGARNVTVTAAGGTSNAVTFTVTVPPAGLFSISPNTGARGTIQPVTLTGISFVMGANPATGIAVTGGGITVSAFTVVSDTSITANFTIAATAALTARNVTVTTTGAPTTPVTFTIVNPGTPIINSISPASGLRRTAAAANPVAVTLLGSNFTAGSTVNVVAPANGLTVTGVTIVSPTQINATFNTTATATIGPRSITVTNPGGTSGPATYTVLGPVLTSIAPTSAPRGQGAAIPVDIFGSGLTGASAVTVSGGGITVGPITVVSDTQISTTFTISATAAGTARTVTVTAPGGVSNSVAFTVTIPATPTLASISPATGVRGTTVPVTLTGTNFITGETTVAVSGTGVTVSGVTVTSPTTVTATFTISTTATLSARTVTVTVAGAAAASNTVPFTVQGATITSIAPDSATHPATGTLAVPVVITGVNLTGATGLTGLGGGVSAAAGTFTVVNSTTINVTLNVSSTATTGIRNIGVTTPIGTTNTLPFTVN
jgi:IPT/TIG domain